MLAVNRNLVGLRPVVSLLDPALVRASEYEAQGRPINYQDFCEGEPSVFQIRPLTWRERGEIQERYLYWKGIERHSNIVAMYVSSFQSAVMSWSGLLFDYNMVNGKIPDVLLDDIYACLPRVVEDIGEFIWECASLGAQLKKS